MPSEDLGIPLQAEKLLGALTRNGVDFVVIGGVAGLVHGSSYPTYDLDVVYARDKANLARMVSALEEIGVVLRGAPPDLPFQLDVRTLENGANFTFETAWGSFDILGEAAGMRTYDALRTDARIDTIGEITVRVASLSDLIAMKRAANRVKDKLMVEEYIVLADEQKQKAREEKGRGKG